MKPVVSIAGLLLLAIVFALILWPFGPGAPELSIPKAPSGQEERALHLELGLIYERSGLLDKAQGEYEQAIRAQQDDITNAAKDGLERVLARQHNPWLRIQASSRVFLVWAMENGLKLLVIVGVAWLVWRIVDRLPRRPGYLLLPFQDHTGKKVGESLANIIHITLQTARLAHLTGEPSIFALSENLNMPGFGVLEEKASATADLLAAIDTVKVGTIDLPLGQLVSAIQRWTNMQAYALSGNVHHFGSLLWLEMEMRNTHTGAIERVWESRETLLDKADMTERIVALSHDLAYQILYDLCSRLEANSWRSLQLFTEALKEMQYYQTEQTDLTILESAAHKLEKAIALDPGYLLAKYNLGIFYNNLGQYRQAVDVFQEVKEANGWLKLEATYNLGVAYYHLFQDWAYEQAIEQFQEVLNQLGERVADRQHRSLLALTHCGLANVHAQQIGRKRHEAQELFDKVRRHCDQAIALADEDREIQAVAHAALGIAYLNQGASKQAVDEFKVAARLKPNYLITYVYLGEIYLKQDDWVSAISWLQRAVHSNPWYEYAHYKLGGAYRTQGEKELAMEAYRQAPHVADAHNDLGKLLGESRQYGEALAEFRQAIALNSQLAEAHSNLAWYIIEAGRRDETSLREAAESARRALQLNQDTEYEWHSRDVLGWVYYHCERLEDAERELQASIEKNPKRAQSRYHLAQLYRTKGENDKARQTLIGLFNETEEKGLWRDKAEKLMRDLETQVT
jgi:tetratricopeptide (TPR) repeat protein